LRVQPAFASCRENTTIAKMRGTFPIYSLTASKPPVTSAYTVGTHTELEGLKHYKNSLLSFLGTETPAILYETLRNSASVPYRKIDRKNSFRQFRLPRKKYVFLRKFETLTIGSISSKKELFLTKKSKIYRRTLESKY
jgi:hypothetical protein